MAKELIVQILAEHMKARGFRKKGLLWAKNYPNWVVVVQLRSNWGKLTLDLGVYFSELKPIEAKHTPSVIACH